MTGSSSTKARLSIIEQIKDLGENDFFLLFRIDSFTPVLNVLSDVFNGTDNFVRASPENKLAATKEVSEMSLPRGTADFTKGLKTAYDILSVSKYSVYNFLCEKISSSIVWNLMEV